MPLNWLVLECGPDPHFIKDRKHQKKGQFEDLLGCSADKFEFYNVYEKHFPSAKQINRCDVVVLTGSRFDAHGTEDWIRDLRQMCLYTVCAGKKLLGICFGHQLIARVFGGDSGRAKQWEVGCRRLSMTPAFYTLLDELELKEFEETKFAIYESHQDQVKVLPGCAELLASSPKCPIEMYRIGCNVLCLQGHPEWEHTFAKNLLLARKPTFPEEIQTDLVESLEYCPTKLAWQRILRAWCKAENQSLLPKESSSSCCSAAVPVPGQGLTYFQSTMSSLQLHSKL
jgi:GMP synthase-like glutamine amidotransferase